MVVFLKDLKVAEDINVMYIYNDNADENESFERLCKQEGMGEKFNSTTPCTAEQNS